MSCYYCNSKRYLSVCLAFDLFDRPVVLCDLCIRASSSDDLAVAACSFCMWTGPTKAMLHGMCRECTFIALGCYQDVSGLSFLAASQLLVALEHGGKDVQHVPPSTKPSRKRVYQEVSEEEGRYV